jgi:hypothetical protein
MATASPLTGASPNPNALKFQLDVTLPETISFKTKDEAEAAGNGFAAAVLGVDGVVSMFATNDFVTVTRRGDADWEPIIEAVTAAAAKDL